MSDTLTQTGVHPAAEIGEGCVIEPEAIIGPNVRLGRNCRVEAYAVIRGDEQGGAEFGDDCLIGAHAFVGPRVRVGNRCRLYHHASVEGRTTMGDDNQVFAGAVLGGQPQDLSFPVLDTRLEIGNSNQFREHVTVSIGTPKERGLTEIGSRCLFMIASHVGHDCIVEDEVIFTNGVLAGGHVKIEKRAVIAGGVLLAPFVTVGRYSHISGGLGVDRDVPPYMLFFSDTQRGRVIGVNAIGLRRGGFPPGVLENLRTACKKVFLHRSEGLEKSLAELERDGPHTDEIDYLIRFMRNSIAGRFNRAREALRMKK
jgi:UDP-N-acetylglucosamine acyltransferase